MKTPDKRKVTERFLHYITYDTASCRTSESSPTTTGQKALAALLAKELRQLGAHDVRMDERSYVYAVIPATPGLEGAPQVGFIAHMDTVNEVPHCVNPRWIAQYTGGDILLNEEEQIWMRVEDFPALAGWTGQDLIVTDGKSLLGADDKAGIAAIMTMAEMLLQSTVPHGAVRIAFTPDEEVGRGAKYFDLKQMGADFAYTVDGAELGELQYENFNGAAAIVTIQGRSVHPGSAKDKMINAANLATQFHQLLPAEQRPEHTEGREGFFFLHDLTGSVEQATLHYIIRDHDTQKFQQKLQLIQQAGKYLNFSIGYPAVQVQVQEQYYNMETIVREHMEVIAYARQAMEELGITPKIIPIRGGTDGAALTRRGLVCPNLGVGGMNFHGRFEVASVDQMEQNACLLAKIVQIVAGI